CGHFTLLRCSETTSKDREVAASLHGDTPCSGNSVTPVPVTPYTTSVDVNPSATARDSQINTAPSAYRPGSVLLAAPSRSVPAHSDQTPGQYTPRGCPPGGRPFAVAPSTTWRMTAEGARPPTRLPPDGDTPPARRQGRL